MKNINLQEDSKQMEKIDVAFEKEKMKHTKKIPMENAFSILLHT